MISKYVPSEEFPTYADYRRAKQREYKAAWKKRNPEKVRVSERVRQKRQYASDSDYAERMRKNA